MSVSCVSLKFAVTNMSGRHHREQRLTRRNVGAQLDIAFGDAAGDGRDDLRIRQLQLRVVDIDLGFARARPRRPGPAPRPRRSAPVPHRPRAFAAASRASLPRAVRGGLVDVLPRHRPRIDTAIARQILIGLPRVGFRHRDLRRRLFEIGLLQRQLSLRLRQLRPRRAETGLRLIEFLLIVARDRSRSASGRRRPVRLSSNETSITRPAICDDTLATCASMNASSVVS